jgi:hypothetical protein
LPSSEASQSSWFCARFRKKVGSAGSAAVAVNVDIGAADVERSIEQKGFSPKFAAFKQYGGSALISTLKRP